MLCGTPVGNTAQGGQPFSCVKIPALARTMVVRIMLHVCYFYFKIQNMKHDFELRTTRMTNTLHIYTNILLFSSIFFLLRICHAYSPGWEFTFKFVRFL